MFGGHVKGRCWSPHCGDRFGLKPGWPVPPLRIHTLGEKVTISEEMDDEAKARRDAGRPNSVMDNQVEVRDRFVLFEPGSAGRCKCCIKWGANREYRSNLPDI